MGSIEGAPGIGCLQLTLEMHLRFFQQHSTHNTSTHNNLSTNNTVLTNNTLAFLQPFRVSQEECHSGLVDLLQQIFRFLFVELYSELYFTLDGGPTHRALSEIIDWSPWLFHFFLIALIVSLFIEVVILVGQMGGSWIGSKGEAHSFGPGWPAG